MKSEFKILQADPGSAWLAIFVAVFAISAVTVTVAAPLSQGERAELLEIVNDWGKQYDPEVQMIRRPFSSPGYHTTLKGGDVHPTRDSLDYAVALLDTGDPKCQKRAEEILRKVISLQDQDPASKTYGIWSWFLEEPLSQMSPPDWNWADFCGVRLLQVALNHRDRLPGDLVARVDDAIRHAGRSIQRRNVGPGYTNIALMGAYVTLVAAELYGLDDLKSYAMQRLRRFHSYTKEQGAFTEYNSPTYTVVALQEIGRLRLHAKDPEAKGIADDLYQVAWEEIATHFHPPTRQWAGPHSRCYSTLLPERTLALFQRATGGRARFFTGELPKSREQYGLPLPCPPSLEHHFIALKEPRELVKTFVAGENPVVGTTYLAPEFALGSVNRGDLWNQRRALLAYWGTADKPAYLHLRFLRDNYDFADAQFFSVQKKGTVLAGVAFGTDGGNTHVSLDRIKNATVKARDLRLRFEFGGGAGSQVIRSPSDIRQPAELAFGKVKMSLQIGTAVFGDFNGRYHSSLDSAKKVSALDVVLYSGEEREFRLDQLKEAALGFCLQISVDAKESPVFSADRVDGMLQLKTAMPELKLRVPLKPAKVSDLHKQRASRSAHGSASLTPTGSQHTSPGCLALSRAPHFPAEAAYLFIL